ncbi:MAG: hypothetical protein ACRD1X_11850 [Vicinamibacteria bacterium]
MIKRVVLLLVLLTFAHSTTTLAQSLSDLLGHLFESDPCQFQDRSTPGEGFLCLESRTLINNRPHDPRHFQGPWQNLFVPFNTALATELTALPLPSPASGFTYSLDAGTGEVTRSTESFGPIFAERAETIGRRRFAMGFTYQYFTFDSFNDFDLARMPLVFEHDDAAASGGLADVVTSVVSIDTRVGQFSAYFTYGLTDFLDMSYAIPVLDVDMRASATAVLRRVGSSGNPSVHFFPNRGVDDPSNRRDAGDIASPFYGDRAEFEISGRAAGIGDIIIRTKATVAKAEKTGLALGLDMRLPTGNEEDFLGSGTLGVTPFVVVSLAGRVSPHGNVAYQWNGKSSLADSAEFGDNGEILEERETGDLPDQLLYVFGADIGIHPNFTLALDFLGRWVIDGFQPMAEDFVTRLIPGSPLPQETFTSLSVGEGASFNTATAAIGIKANVGGNLLVDMNLLVKLDDNGLGDVLTPLLGIEYCF